MPEYINREELLKDIEDSVRFSSRNGVSAELRGAHKIVDRIRSAPTADVVEVVHAYWKETTHITESKRGREIHSKLYNCSNCDAPNGRKKSSYCHWCGAKMYGERKCEE